MLAGPLIAAAIALVSLPVLAQTRQLSDAERNEMMQLLTDGDLRTHQLVEIDGAFKIEINRGKEKLAKNYYRLINDEYLELSSDILGSSIEDLLAYCGYEDLRVRDIERLSSVDLMGRSETQDEILATRFFAPKIMDVSGKTFPFSYGWRKLVRLRVRSGSKAEAAGIASVYVLFNYFTETPEFPDADAGAIQSILVRAPTNADGFPVYFFVYGGQPNYDIRLFLNASFEAATRDPNEKYFVPNACAQCHGAGEDTGARTGKVNYLDTDHWFDRAREGDDFRFVAPRNVLPDGGRPGSWAFRRAFRIYKKLNAEILAQNRSVDPDGFQVKAVSKWIDLHRFFSRPRPPTKRGLAGDVVWGRQDRELIEGLNRYCFRCHSSFSYHVFDKVAVKELAIDMQELIADGTMPLDRQLGPSTKTELIHLLDQLSEGD